jgi:phosphatidylinositol alpha-1,6-mannosyltransferase
MRISSPLVAAITLHSTGGGIAVVSELLWRVVQREWGEHARLLTMFEHENRPATAIEKGVFSLALSKAELLRETDWILFSHLALARVQNVVPARLRRPYGVFIHGIETWKSLAAGERTALLGANILLANSRYTANRFSEMHPDIGPVIPCPLALLPADDIRSEAVPPSYGSRTVLVVGRMAAAERYKGHDQLIDAWPLVIDRVSDAQLVIVGEGDDVARLKQKATASAAKHSIVFTGFVSKPALQGLYKRAALFALPSRGEGFGLVYLEAMSHGLPCVGSIHDAAPEIIVDGQTGRLVDQGDIEGLAACISTLLLDPTMREAMGTASRERFLTEFSFERFRRRLLELLPSTTDGGIADK